MHACCNAISDVSVFIVGLEEVYMTVINYVRIFLAVQDHSTASLVSFLSSYLISLHSINTFSKESHQQGNLDLMYHQIL